MHTLDADVVIVGCGPVGAALAILLGQYGRRVAVLERQPQPYPLPRAVHFDHEVGRILQACGLGPELRDISEPAEIYEWRNREGTTLLRFGRIGASGSGWPESSMFNQPALEALLERRALELPTIEIRRGVEVVACEQADHHVVLFDTDGREYRGRYAIGCDGANSTVRSLIDVPVHDLGFFYDWLVVDVVLDEPRVFDPINVQVCDPARPTTVVSGGPGRRRWEFMCLPDECIDDLNDLDRAWELLAPWDVTPENARLERHAVYKFKARYATQWRRGRVLLAGDAAHQMPPFAGQGMCAGIRDAANLAWKLDLVLDGRADDALLDTYEQERMPHARTAIEFSIELGKVICVPDPAAAARRDEEMAALVGPEPTVVPDLPGLQAGAVHPRAPYAGCLFVQGAAHEGLFDDVHGVGWRLITIDPARVDLDPSETAWFEQIGGAVVQVADSGDACARWFAEHDASWALQRPDFHLYGTARDAQGARKLVRDLRRQLPDPTATSGVPR